VNDILQSEAPPYRCTEPKRPLARLHLKTQPSTMFEIRIGGQVEIVVSPDDGDPMDREVVVGGHAVWLQLREKMIILQVDDDRQNPERTGFCSGDFVWVHLEEITMSEFSESEVVARDFMRWMDTVEEALRAHDFYSEHPEYDHHLPGAQKTLREYSDERRAAYLDEMRNAKQAFLNKLAVERFLPAANRVM